MGGRVVALTDIQIDFIAETASTNADLARAICSGGAILHEGYWRVADRQTAGRGRLGRNWSDGAGNFMGSTVVHLRSGDPPAHSLALLCGIAVHRTIKTAIACTAGDDVPHVTIKWPNDIMCGDAKLAGILAERVHDSVILGVGVNLCSAPPVEGRLTSALADLGCAIDRDAFAHALARGFYQMLVQWRGGGWPSLMLREWESRAHPAGTMLTVNDGAQAGLTGAFDGLDGDGGLRLRLSDGSIRVVHAGEVQRA